MSKTTATKKFLAISTCVVFIQRNELVHAFWHGFVDTFSFIKETSTYYTIATILFIKKLLLSKTSTNF